MEVFKKLNVTVSCLGNHDTDYGLSKMSELIAKTEGIWLMANCFLNGKTIGELPRSHVLTYCGHKIGLFGLCEPDWLGTLNPNTVTEELVFTDFLECAHEMTTLLKSQGCTYIIALTHMRLPNDRILAENCSEIDLILGGHDHSTVHEVVNGVTIVKSGSDFEEFSDLSIDVSTREVRRERVLITEQFLPDPEVEKHVLYYTKELNSKLDKVCGHTETDIEGRFEKVRTQETSMGNWIVDLLYTEYPVCDVVLLNCGTMRSNCIIRKGEVTFKQLAQMLPMPDKIV